MSQSETEEYRELRNVAEDSQKKDGCCRRHPVCCGTTLVVIALVGLVVAAGLGGSYVVIREEVDTFIQSQFVLTPGSPATDNWVSSDAPIYMKVFFFNLTNPQAVQFHNATPHVEQVGPFTFREYKKKSDLKWMDGDKRVQYSLNTTYVWQNFSNESDPSTTNVTTVNLPLFGVLVMLEKLESNPNTSSQIKKIISLIDELKNDSGWDGLFYSHTINELMWGYEDPLLKLLWEFAPTLVPSPIFALSNKSEVDKLDEVYTGKGDLNRLGDYITWKGNTIVEQWGTPEARMINGTDGTLFHPGVSSHENLTIFITEIFRSGYISFVNTTSRHGIHLYRYRIPDVELRNDTQDKGFYPGAPSGVLNLTAVSPGNAPIYASKPHFLGADPVFRKNVTGMNPNPALHDSTLEVEPLTGSVLAAFKRIQLNLRMKRFEALPETALLREEFFLPVYYGSEEGTVTKSLADKFKKSVYGARYGFQWGLIGLIALGGLIFVVCLLCFFGMAIQQRWCPRANRVKVKVVNERTPLITGSIKDGEIDI